MKKETLYLSQKTYLCILYNYYDYFPIQHSLSDFSKKMKHVLCEEEILGMI
jgi:hypothetical protein